MPLSRRVSKEKALADKIEASLDTLDFNYADFAHVFMEHGGAIQKNAFEMVLMLLHHWAMRYKNGLVHPGNMTYVMCQMSYKMMCAIGGNKP